MLSFLSANNNCIKATERLLSILKAWSTATNNDITTVPVRHLLVITEYVESIGRQALNDWCLSDKKDHKIFAIKHLINDSLEWQDNKVNNRKEWWDKRGISCAPTCFINRYRLPKIYSVSD